MSLAFGAHALHYNYATDDAFITFRYVRNMLAGHGLVYNVGERVEGYTNFLWAMLIAAPTALGADIVRSAKVLGFLSGVGTLVLVTAIARTYMGRIHTALLLLPAALLAANGSFAMWSLGGLETVFFTFLLTLITFVYLRAEDSGAPYACGFLFSLLVMTRPDGVVFLAAMLAHMVVTSVYFRKDVSRKRLVADVVRLLLAFLVVYLPYFLWRYSYYGYLLPNTFYAKVGAGAASAVRGLRYTWFFFADYGFVPIAAAAAFFYARMWSSTGGGSGRKIGFATSYLLLQVAACIAFVIYVGGDQLVMHRFFVPILPALYLLSLRGFGELFPREDERSKRGGSLARRAALAAACVAGIIVTCLPSFVGGEHRRVFYVEKPADADRKVVGQWLKENVGGDTTIALTAAGIVPFYSGLETIDLVGLNDVHIARTEVARFGRGEPGHEKYNSAYVLERRPDLIFLGACRIWPHKLTTQALLKYYWLYGILVPGNREMLGLDEFRRNYTPHAARVGSGYIHFFKRNDFHMPAAEPLAGGPLPLTD